METDRKFDVIALGELLVDFTEYGQSGQGNQIFEACPGGAPCNVLAMLQKWGKKTAFIGRVGRDRFGFMLQDVIRKAGIDDSGLVWDEQVNTTLTFVHTQEGGEREFSFYRNPGADMMLREEDVREELIRQGRIFHFGTLSMTSECARAATQKALRLARGNGLLVSFDPNLRPPLWKSMQEARKQMEYGLSRCDILKISDNELQFVTDREDYEEGVRLLQERYRIPLILLTMGREGSRAYYRRMRVEMPAFLQENTVDATGAGDTFCGSALYYLLEQGMEGLDETGLKEMLKLCNAAASLITTRKGVIRSLPEREEILRILS